MPVKRSYRRVATRREGDFTGAIPFSSWTRFQCISSTNAIKWARGHVLPTLLVGEAGIAFVRVVPFPIPKLRVSGLRQRDSWTGSRSRIEPLLARHTPWAIRTDDRPSRTNRGVFRPVQGEERACSGSDLDRRRSVVSLWHPRRGGRLGSKLVAREYPLELRVRQPFGSSATVQRQRVYR